jgi:hypothetical protein
VLGPVLLERAYYIITAPNAKAGSVLATVIWGWRCSRSRREYCA